MAENKKAHPEDESSSFARFIREHVAPLSRAFAESPLMQLRVKTPRGTITLAKASPGAAHEAGELARPAGALEAVETARPTTRSVQAARIYNGEAGRAYVTVNAAVVGIFRDLAEPPSTGDKLETGRVLGYIEALRLRNEVRCPIDGTLIAQVVVDGQPVDFGEALFVVDSGGVAVPQVPVEAEGTEGGELAEPPRI